MSRNTRANYTASTTAIHVAYRVIPRRRGADRIKPGTHTTRSRPTDRPIRARRVLNNARRVRRARNDYVRVVAAIISRRAACARAIGTRVIVGA